MESNVQYAGAITGHGAGGIFEGYDIFPGVVIIRRSFSTGDISGNSAGGIGGATFASQATFGIISECYSLGAISGIGGAGGLAGVGSGGDPSSQVSIENFFSRGDITASEAAGIAGGTPGRLLVKNVYASGKIDDAEAGGIFGSGPIRDYVEVKFSVHSPGPIVGRNGDKSEINANEGNSDDFSSIMGKLYHVNGTQAWPSDKWSSNPDGLPMLSDVPACGAGEVRSDLTGCTSDSEESGEDGSESSGGKYT